jgi:hypothetical protein
LPVSLSARQERVLNLIERSLHVCEPNLGSMFAIFTEMVSGEEMPWLEQLEFRSFLFWRWHKRRARPLGGKRTVICASMSGAPSTSLRVITLVTAVLIALTLALVVGFSIDGGSRCGSAIRPEHSAATLNAAKACPPVMLGTLKTTERMSA